MPATLLEQLANQVPSLKRRFVRKQADIAVQIREILEEKQWTQRDLASAANLKESYISKLLHGGANPTLKTICTIEEALGTEILIAPIFVGTTDAKTVAVNSNGTEQPAQRPTPR